MSYKVRIITMKWFVPWFFVTLAACSSSGEKVPPQFNTKPDKSHIYEILSDSPNWFVSPSKLKGLSHEERIQFIKADWVQFLVTVPGETAEDWRALEMALPQLTSEKMSQIYTNHLEAGCKSLNTISGSVSLSKEVPSRRVEEVHHTFCAAPFDLMVTSLNQENNSANCSIWGSTPSVDDGAMILTCGSIDGSENIRDMTVNKGTSSLSPDYGTDGIISPYVSCRVKHRLLLETPLQSLTCNADQK